MLGSFPFPVSSLQGEEALSPGKRHCSLSLEEEGGSELLPPVSLALSSCLVHQLGQGTVKIMNELPGAIWG